VSKHPPRRQTKIKKFASRKDFLRRKTRAETNWRADLLSTAWLMRVSLAAFQIKSAFFAVRAVDNINAFYWMV
jgi:hypothetical protein